MKAIAGRRTGGFTLIELLTALLILSLLGLMSYRGLGAVLDTRDHVAMETDKWRRMNTFFARFERDIHLAAPRPVRSDSAVVPAWHGVPGKSREPQLVFSRFASLEGVDRPRRVGYGLDGQHEIELWLWPGTDVVPGTEPVSYPVLTGVIELEFQYLNSDLVWVDAWPMSPTDAVIPMAVRLRILLDSGEEIVRVFALTS